MARLNESTASAEPIEILKRRFVRQNREIARVNSIQSLRIRSLESEVSHLLSENVSLREQIITLTQDLERFEAAKTLHDGVYDVKTRLDNKLVELSSLITELGSLPRRCSKTTCEKSEPTADRRPRESGFARQVNDPHSESSFGVETDGKLPVILEDKYYPRRTLSAQELQEFANNETDLPSSAELEDPASSPKQSIECDEAPTKSPTAVINTNPKVDDTDDEHSLPPNLETRKKKRIGPTTVNKKQTEMKSTSLLDSRFTRKCGAKRKFSVEEEESFFESAPAEDDGFEFSRPVQSPGKSSSQNGHSPFKRKTQLKEGAIGHVQPKRKVLEPKTTNATALSPMKPNIKQNPERHQNSAITKNNENIFPRQDKSDQSRSKDASPNPNTPISGNDSGTTKAKLKGDVPPLHNIEQPEFLATTDMPNNRPSRRRGAVVSYAEPNLRDKMRRSTNELGPAVNKDNPRNSSSHTDPNREPHEQLSGKNTSTKKARNSSITNGEHDLVSDKPPGEYSRRNSNTTPEIRRQYSAGIDDDGEKDDMGSQYRYSHGRSEKELEDQMFGSIPQRQDTTQDYQLSTHTGSDVSMNADQTASVTTRKSRRHSSNTKPSGRSTTPRFFTSTMSVEGVCNDLGAAYSGSGSSINELSVCPIKTDKFSVTDSHEYIHTSSLMNPRETTRGQRVAARRRSMML
ncbi:hypothetical protein BJX76DRAFT_347260 [Aspergillus varians]